MILYQGAQTLMYALSSHQFSWLTVCRCIPAPLLPVPLTLLLTFFRKTGWPSNISEHAPHQTCILFKQSQAALTIMACAEGRRPVPFQAWNTCPMHALTTSSHILPVQMHIVNCIITGPWFMYAAAFSLQLHTILSAFTWSPDNSPVNVLSRHEYHSLVGCRPCRAKSSRRLYGS